MTYDLRQVKADATRDSFRPEWLVRSIGIYNNSNQRVTVTDAAGSAYVADANTIRCQPCVPSGQYFIQAAGRISVGHCFVDFSNVVRGFVFGGGQPSPVFGSITPGAAPGNAHTLVKDTTQLCLYLQTAVASGLISLTAVTPGNAATQRLLTSVMLTTGTDNGVGIPIIIDILLTVGTVLTLTGTAGVVLVVGY